jgi:hypothetical protein
MVTASIPNIPKGKVHRAGVLAFIDKLLDKGILFTAQGRSGTQTCLINVGMTTVKVFVTQQEESAPHWCKHRENSIEYLKLSNPEAIAVYVRLKENPSDTRYFIVPVPEVPIRQSSVHIEDLEPYEDQWQLLIND